MFNEILLVGGTSLYNGTNMVTHSINRVSGCGTTMYQVLSN